ncbi:MAG: zf-HC2 domain-containing protein [Planctomycetota bacterium]
MNCGCAREFLSARLDGALTDAEAKELREHLETCAECRSRAAGLEDVVGLVREIPAPELGRSLAPDVVACLPRKRRPAPIRWLVPLAAAACLLIVARFALFDAPVEEALEVAATDEAPVEKISAPERWESGPGTREPADLPKKPPSAPSAAPQDVMDTGAGLGADAPPAGKAGGLEERVRSGDVRRYSVRGAEPDAAAGVILAELRSRRSREGERDREAAGAGEARVVQGPSGDVAGMVLALTAAEIEFVTCLLEERPGVRVDRVNGRGKKAPAGAGAAPEAESDDGDDAVERRVRVRLDFAGR